MPLQDLEITDGNVVAADPRWDLVQRIVASPRFVKSERLTSFLVCICELSREGRQHQINEQYIGIKVFGRRPNYDPAVDSIVRSHASRLRHRLSEYFQDEGAHEEWTLTVPKGSYLPVFEERRLTAETYLAVEASPTTARVWDESFDDAIRGGSPLRQTVSEEMQPELSNSRGLETAAAATGATIRVLRRWLIAAIVVSVLCLAWSARVTWQLAHPAGPLSESKRLFWTRLFNSTDHTLVVNADSGLVLLQNATKQRVSLPMYLGGSYLGDTARKLPVPVAVQDLASRRYSTTVDLSINAQILRMTGIDLANTRFAFARDLRLNELKQGNLVLLGTYESTPWVQLFEPAMNFYFRDDLAQGDFVLVNRRPQPGEQAIYNARADDPEKTVYGVVAYRPALNGVGKVLILEGQSMAGTESASDFVFDDGYFLPFLKSIQRPDGSIPYFELLVRSTNMSGDASRLDVLARRVEDR